jgi:hypothetical protein
MKRRIPLLEGVFGAPLDRHPQGSEVCLSIALTSASFFAFSFGEKAKVDVRSQRHGGTAPQPMA